MVIHHQRTRPAANPCSVPGDCDSSALQRPSSSNRKPHKGVDRQSAEQTATEYESQTRLIAAQRDCPSKRIQITSQWSSGGCCQVTKSTGVQNHSFSPKATDHRKWQWKTILDLWKSRTFLHTPATHQPRLYSLVSQDSGKTETSEHVVSTELLQV